MGKSGYADLIILSPRTRNVDPMTLLLLLLLEVVQAAPDIMQGVVIVALSKAQRPGRLDFEVAV